MHRRTLPVVSLILALLFSAVASVQFAYFAVANPDGSSAPNLAMSVEYVNYTITRVNGSLLAKIDGTYPIYIFTQSDCPLPDQLPMVYPTPPGTTNIHVWLNDAELSWSNYTEAYPTELHHTAIGDWTMIYSVLSPVSDFFTMKIHYEHPLQMVNGSYLFLYDLNIWPYLLSPLSNNSTAFFTIRMETSSSNLQAFTTGTQDGAWNPINFTTSKEGATDIVNIEMYSELSKPLLGDLVVIFSDTEIPGLQFWQMPIVLSLLILIIVALKVKDKIHFHIKPHQTNGI